MDFIHNCDGGKYSSLVGWVIRQGNVMMENDSRMFELKEALNTAARFGRVTPRNLTGWAVCLYFLEKVISVCALKCLYFVYLVSYSF